MSRIRIVGRPPRILRGGIFLVSRLAFALAFALSFACGGAYGAEPARVVLRDVHVVDVRDGTIARDRAVTLEGTRIARIEPDATLRVPAGARVVAGAGGYLIPGLVDMHLHSFLDEDDPAWVFPLLVANGVTAVRDMGSLVPLVKIRKVRDEIESGERVGPHLHVAGPVLDGLNTVWEAPIGVPTPAEAATAVATLHAQGAEFVKVFPMLTRAAYFAVVAEATRRKLPVAGQVPESVTVEDAARAGQRSFEHMEKLVMACSALERDIADWRERILQSQNGLDELIEAGPEQLDEVLDSADPARCARTIRALARAGAWVVPALVGEDALRPRRHDPNDSRLAYLPPKLREAWVELDLALRAEIEPAQERRVNRLVTRMKNLVPVLRAAGVPLLAGTNAGMFTPFVFPGWSLHEELATLVESGLTPLEALQAATVNPARYFGQTARAGEVAPGKAADLVLLDANPVADIRATRAIRLVVANGRVLSRAEIDRLLESAKR